ncbi:tRNA-dihydrouridine synthase family protein [Candidatus Micrarchaeota archaeon]|nr:tRNA-dihydrouridine synthase family protein [Candidatus Micrarchaeota archaeon]MBU1681599.1 tRNA-dihydrouridine synthase family protein [Candidatus Micrarchaeota archaeon]
MIYKSYLAPIDEYSDFAFRLLCQRHGADATCIPLVNSMAIVQGKLSIVDAKEKERNLGVQIVGNDPKIIGKACEIISMEKPFLSWFNLNCGCPSSRTMDSGGGSAMLAYPKKISQALSEMKKKVDKPVSVKIRVKTNRKYTIKLCKELVKTEIDSIILHGRTPKQGYSGKADWELIRAVSSEVDIPIIGNGDIVSLSQGKGYVEDGYCDSFMVGRAAMSNPMLFSDEKPESFDDKIKLLEEYVEIHRKYSEPSVKHVRSKAINFLSGVDWAAKLRNSLSRAKSVVEILTMIEKQAEENP